MGIIAQRWSRVPKLVQIAVLVAAVLLLPPITIAVERATNFGLLTQINRALIFVVLALG